MDKDHCTGIEFIAQWKVQSTAMLPWPASSAGAMNMDEQSRHEPRLPHTSTGAFARLSGYIASALRYWERQRLIYNAVLALVVVGHFAAAWPQSRQHLSIDLLLGLFVLAVLANMFYCAAYFIDIFVQLSGLDQAWRKGRVVVLLVGTAFAAIVARYAAMSMFTTH